MDFDENLAAVHAYLCADGYVIKNPPTQKQKYYKIGFRNTNLILLKDFQDKFEKVFGIKPHLAIGERCALGSKEIYELLTKEFGSFYSWHWKMPDLSIELSKIWLRAYFDCEGWITIETRQNRNIGVDCVNKIGLKQVKKALSDLGINSKLNFRNKQKIYRIYIFGKENIIKFKQEIGFLHPKKSEKLDNAIKDYVDYFWHFPENARECKKFIHNLLKEKIRIKKPHYLRIISKEEINLQKLKGLLKKFYDINCLVNKLINGFGTIYYELDINRKDEVKKLIRRGFIHDIFKNDLQRATKKD
jgi:hypothetical protein